MLQNVFLICLNREAETVFKQPMDLIYKARIPWRAVIEVTNLCQLNCIHCFHGDHRGVEKELSTNEIYCLISELRSIGTMQLTITGGEATLRPDIIDIIDYAISNDMNVQLLSNGQIDFALLEKLSQFKHKFAIEISLMGVYSANDQIVQRNGAYKRTINAIEYLLKSGINVTVNTVVMKQNFSQLHEISKVLEGLNAKWSHSPLIYGDREYSYRLDDSQLCYYYQMFPGETELMSNLNKIDPKNINYDIGCNAGCTTVLIAANGDVFPCVWLREMRVGNIREEKLSVIWAKSKVSSFEDFGCDECLSCIYYPICKRCPAYSYSEFGSYSQKPIEWCRQMKAQESALRSQSK